MTLDPVGRGFGRCQNEISGLMYINAANLFHKLACSPVRSVKFTRENTNQLTGRCEHCIDYDIRPAHISTLFLLKALPLSPY